MNQPPYPPWWYQQPQYQAPYPPQYQANQYPGNGNGSMGDMRERVKGMEGDIKRLQEDVDSIKDSSMPERLSRLEGIKDASIKWITWGFTALVAAGMATGYLSLEQGKTILGILPPGVP